MWCKVSQSLRRYILGYVIRVSDLGIGLETHSHSVSSCWSHWILWTLSAIMFSAPGKCSAVNIILLSRQYFHRSTVRLNRLLGLVDPIFMIWLTVVVLSVFRRRVILSRLYAGVFQTLSIVLVFWYLHMLLPSLRLRHLSLSSECICWILGTICDLDLWPHSWRGPWIFQGQISK